MCGGALHSGGIIASFSFLAVFFLYQVLSASVCVRARLCGKTNESAAVFVQMVHLAEIS